MQFYTIPTVNHKEPLHLVLFLTLILLFNTFSSVAIAEEPAFLTPPVPPKLGDALKVTSLPKGNKPQKSPMRARGVPADQTGGWSIDTTNRQLTRGFYNSIYLASENTPDGWGGVVASCDEGTTSSNFKNSVLVRVNYFRAMSGIPANVGLSATYSNKAQKAALMMSSNNSLSHTPPSTWSCYTAEGAEAAGSSNISLGSYGWGAVSGQVRDNGSNNEAVGHRRWILYPQTQTVGTGDIPPTSGNPAANSLWVFDSHYSDPRPATREAYVAWPPPGYVPYQVVPARWSFSYPGANFSNATVTMTSSGNSVSVNTLPIHSGYGENTIAWGADGLDANSGFAKWPQPTQDTSYTVNVDNVSIAGSPTNFSYVVTVIDPNVSGAGELFSTINNGPNPRLGEQGSFTFTEVPFAFSYEVLLANVQDGNIFEGGENGLSGIVDGTSASYDLHTGLTSATGSYSFHLATPNASSFEYFEIDKSIIPSATSSLNFQSQLGYSTSSQVALAQISTDDGHSWKTIYSQSGLNGSGESSFSAKSVSLSTYAQRFIKVRFGYEFKGGSYYSCTGSHCGFLVDNIEVTNGQEITSRSIIPTSTPSFSFLRNSAAPYVMAVRTVAWDGYSALEWGPQFILPEAQTRIELRNAIEGLGNIAAGASGTTLGDIISILQILSGN